MKCEKCVKRKELIKRLACDILAIMIKEMEYEDIIVMGELLQRLGYSTLGGRWELSDEVEDLTIFTGKYEELKYLFPYDLTVLKADGE
jgi:hypothetical protein